MKPIFPALVAVLAATSAAAAPRPALEVTGGWSRPAVAGTNGVGYLTIVNRGARPQTLVAVETPVARKVEMHAMSMAGGVMSMAEVKAVAVPAGGKAVFGPGGYHLMLLDLKRPLKVGDRVPARLAFADGAKVAATLSVGLGRPGA